MPAVQNHQKDCPSGILKGRSGCPKPAQQILSTTPAGKQRQDNKITGNNESEHKIVGAGREEVVNVNFLLNVLRQEELRRLKTQQALPPAKLLAGADQTIDRHQAIDQSFLKESILESNKSSGQIKDHGDPLNDVVFPRDPLIRVEPPAGHCRHENEACSYQQMYDCRRLGAGLSYARVTSAGIGAIPGSEIRALHLEKTGCLSAGASLHPIMNKTGSLVKSRS